MKKRLTRLKSIFLLTLLCAAAFTCLSIVRPFTLAASASSTINVSGRVFQDYNGNGIYDISGSASAPAIDLGIPGVIVTAYDPNNVACGTDTTLGGVLANRGEYHIKVTGVGPYRIEFTNLPAGYFPSGTGTDSDAIATAGTSLSTAGTTEQFIPDKTIEGVNLGLNHPSDYCQNNPLVCVAEHIQTSSGVNGGALETFPYDYSSQMDGNLTGSWGSQPSRSTPGPLDPKNIAFANDVGSLYGVAWNPYANAVYTSAFVKKFVQLGALSGESTGAIYVKNNPAAALPTASLYVDLNALFPGAAGANPHPASTTDWSLDTATDAYVGKAGLGDLEISQDGSTLYVVNLFDRRLYTIPTSGPLTTSTIKSYPIPTTINLPTGGCSTKDVRPFALGRDAGGRIYVGAVCSAESTGNPAFLQAYVWYFNAGTFNLVAANTMNYQRTYSSANMVNNQPWSATPNSLAPQLMLSDIEFDRGDMVLGFRDKNGDESFANGGFSVGEILRACKGGALGWTFENNGTCGGVGPTAGLFNNGLGGGEFYHEENGEQKGEGLVGSLLQVPGFNHVMTTSFDAVAYNSAGSPTNNYNTNGVHRYNNTTGALNGAYDIYIGGQPGTFAKANGVGDIEALCDLAPIEIGNRIWNDANGNGTQDAGEMGIPGVTIHLFKGNLPVTGASAVTDANGEYYFSAAAGASTVNRKYSIAISPNTAYEIRLDDPANFAGGGPLAGLSSTTTNVGTNDSIDSDASDKLNPLGSPTGTFPIITLTTGGPGANDHTFDVGFTEKRKEACCGTGENYVKNGNFDDGPKEFKSNFTLADVLTPGDYTVGNSETAIKSCKNWDIAGHANCKEDDNFLIVNGMTNQTTGNALAWGQTVQVPKSDKDETYHFCAWFKDLKACCFNQHPKITLEADINGHNASTDTEVISAPSDKCGWQLVSTDVTVPAGTTNVNLQILLDQNADGDGNDVAIDDISFAGSAPVPVGATDFNIATQVTGGSTDYGITATPLNPQKPDCKYTWTVFEVTADGLSEITTPLTRQTWASTGVSNFPGYFMGANPAGIFRLNHTYRITYRIDCDCMTAREDSFDIRRNPSVLHGLKKGGKNSPARSDFTITRVNPK